MPYRKVLEATQSAAQVHERGYRVEVKSSLNSRLARAAQRIEPASHALSGTILAQEWFKFRAI
jgi:hypothetical protein